MIVLMGMAGSGKGTQGKILADAYSFQLLSMGDLVRQHATPQQRQRMLSGDLLSDDDVIAILNQVLAKLPSLDEVILDGFPRSIPQAEWLLSQVQAGRFKLRKIFHLVASRQASRARLRSRARLDDNDQAIEKRFDEYERSTLPLLKWFVDKGVSVVEVNSERSIDDVQADIVKQLTEA